jgi:putative ABC transport system permease protein
MLEIGPIVKSLLRKPTGPILIILQLAITIAIVSNTLAFIQQRVEFINREPGFETDKLLRIWIKQDETRGDISATIENDLRMLKAQPSVVDAIAINGLPMGSRGGTSGFATAPRMDVKGQEVFSLAASTFEVTEGWMETLGVSLVAGSDFGHDDYLRFRSENTPSSSPIVISKAVAENLFPNQDPIGKFMYMGELVSFNVVGVIENMLGHHVHSDTPYQTVIYPKMQLFDDSQYLVRINDSNEALVLSDLVEKLRLEADNRVVGDEKTMSSVAKGGYQGEVAMITLLTVVLALLVGVNALGVVGLTSFWVSQRRKQIGIRRALGATRLAIIRYFLIENIVLVCIALLIGAIAAMVASTYMVEAYAFEPLPWLYLPIAGFIVMCITLSAAILPVNKAAQISPVEAVASV